MKAGLGNIYILSKEEAISYTDETVRPITIDSKTTFESVAVPSVVCQKGPRDDVKVPSAREKRIL